MSGGFESFEESLALPSRDIELAGSAIREISLYNVLYLFVEWLDGDCVLIRSIADTSGGANTYMVG